jgi:hypothetical protein
VELDHDVHLVADRGPDPAERLERRVELVGRYVEAAPALRGVVERPDLHAGDALLQQGVGEVVGAVEEGVEVLVGAGRRVQAPVAGQLALAAAHVAVAGAGVVGADLLAREAAQALVDRLAGGLAPQVPERDVDRGEAAHLGPAARETQVAGEQVARVPVDQQRVPAEQAGRHALVR